MERFIYKHPFILLLHEKSVFDDTEYTSYITHITSVSERLSCTNTILKSEAWDILEAVHYLQSSIITDIRQYWSKRFKNLPFSPEEFEDLIEDLIVRLMRLLT